MSTVHIRLKDIFDVAVACHVVFYPADTPFFNGPAMVVSGAHSMLIDADGEGSVTLQPGRYTVRFARITGNTDTLIILVPDEEGTYEFKDLICAGTWVLPLRDFLQKSQNLADVADPAAAFNAIKQTATTASAGAVQLATGMEVESGEDAVKAVTPWTLKATKDLAQGSLQRSFNLTDIDDPFAAFNAIKQDAATNFSGVVQLATQAEVNAGTNAVKPVTPATLSGAGYIKSIPAGNTPASLFSQLGEIMVWKPENTTRASTTTKTNDPHLAVNLEAGKTYMVRGQLAYMCSSATPGFSSVISFSGSWAYSGGIISTGTTNTAWSSFSYPDSYASSFATALFTFSRSAQNSGGWWNGMIKTATAGTLNVQWAQLTADAATTTLNAGSYIWLRKLD